MDIIQLNLFDGKMCCACQEWQPIGAFQKNKSTADGLQKQCKECRKLGYSKVKAVLLAKRKQKYWQDPEKARADKRSDHQKHKIKRNKIRLAHRAAHIESENKRTRQWFKDHPDRVRQIAKAVRSRRRARIQSQGGSHTVDQWLAMLDWFDGKCLVCGTPDHIEADHVNPISRGGTDNINNIQPLCTSCNKKKFTKHIDHRNPERLAAFLEHIQCSEPIDNYHKSKRAIP